MNRNVFLSKQAAVLLDAVDREAITRGSLADAADCSDSKSRNMVAGTTAPDAHDLHLICLRSPAVGLSLLSLVTDGTPLGVDYAPVVTVNGTLADAVAASIELTAKATSLCKVTQADAALGRQTPERAAELHGLVQDVAAQLAIVRGLTSKLTARPVR